MPVDLNKTTVYNGTAVCQLSKKQVLSLARQHLFVNFAWITRSVLNNSKSRKFGEFE
jgi:hypothetical protein